MKRRLYNVLFMVLIPVLVPAQSTELFPRYTVVDVYPRPTGDKNLEKIISEYQEKVPRNLNGVVCVDYLVLPNGLIGETRIVSTTPAGNEDLEHEGRMFVAGLPKFTPGILKGETVRTWMRLVLRFGKPIEKAHANEETVIGYFDVKGDEEHSVNSRTKKLTQEEARHVVEQMPSFPGGLNYLMKFLGSNVVYPAECYTNGIQGKVIVGFVVEADGTISDIHIEKSVHPELDKSAIMAVRAMPRWYPGKTKGNKPIKVKYHVPVTFKI